MPSNPSKKERKPFFTPSQIQSRRPLGLVPLCAQCRLDTTCLSPKMPVSGQGKKEILIIGEAPGCVGGDTLIETAFRDKSIYPNGIPIKDLVDRTDILVYCFDIMNQKLAISPVRKIWKTGIKSVYRVTYEWYYSGGGKKVTLRNSIVVSSNHQFLLKRPIKHDPFSCSNPRGIDYLSIDTGLKIGHGIQPFHRKNYDYSHIGVFANKVVKEARFLLSYKLGRPLTDYLKLAGVSLNEECHHQDENKLNDSWDNLILLNTVEHAKHHTEKSNNLGSDEAVKKHREVIKSEEYRHKMSEKMKEVLKNPILREQRQQQIKNTNKSRSETVKNRHHTDPQYYYKYLVGRSKAVDRWGTKISNPEKWVETKFKGRFPNEEFPPTDNHKVISIEYLGEQEVYDMEVQEYHNFAANGIFVHNSTEDNQNRAFVGKAGQYLQTCLSRQGIDLREDCWITNAQSCRPPKNRKPTEKEIESCRPKVINHILELKPKLIILLGDTAVKSVMTWLWKEKVGSIFRWAGWRIPSQQLNSWICPTFHPSYIERSRDKRDRLDPILELYFNQHLEEACKRTERPWKEIPDYRKMVQVIRCPSQAADMIKEVINMNKPTAFDFETEGLKPEMKNGYKLEIVSCSMSNGAVTFAYPWHGDAVTATKEFFLSSVPKIGGNLKFEERFVLERFGHPVNNWVWDTCEAAHILDNRPEISSVKFQAFVRLGQPSYDDSIKPYLRAESGGGYGRNTIKRASLESVLLYCGMDSLLEWKVAKSQAREMGVDILEWQK